MKSAAAEWAGIPGAQLVPGVKRAPKKRDTSGEDGFAFYCRSLKLPQVHHKWKMANLAGTLTPKTKKIAMWEFDFYFPQFHLIIEIDGGIFRPGGGAHSHPVDIRRNMAKRNDAALAGLWLLAFTPEEVRSGHAATITQRKLASLGWDSRGTDATRGTVLRA